jgi:hypothetical protein
VYTDKTDLAKDWIDARSTQISLQKTNFTGLSLSETSSHYLRDGVAEARQVFA